MQNVKINKIAFVAVLLVLLSVNFSCKKAIDVQSTRLSNEEQQWTKYEDAKAGLISCYALLRTALVADNAHWLLGELRNGDFVSTGRPDLSAIISGDLNSTYPVMQSITDWRRYYAVINWCSVYIERSAEILKKDPLYTSINSAADIAQARAIRAFTYFYMVRIWGDVPLITASHDGNFEESPRTDQNKVLAFAMSELQNAAKEMPFHYGGTDPLLPGLYYGGGPTAWNGGLFTKISAYAVMAHISAWQGNYIDTEAYTRFIMDNYTKSGNPSNAAKYIDVTTLTENADASPFAYQRPTQIIGLSFTSGHGSITANGHIEQLTLATPIIVKAKPDIFVPKNSIKKIFTDSKDLRFGIDSTTMLYRNNYFVNYSSNMPVFSKIKVIKDAATSGAFALFSSTIVFTRLEELTLLRAEALAVLGLPDEAAAALNKATELRGILPYSSLQGKDLVDEIFAERRRELMGEGWRWYDLIRYNKIKRNDPAFNKLIDGKGICWPISREVLNRNKRIVQNNYWNN